MLKNPRTNYMNTELSVDSVTDTTSAIATASAAQTHDIQVAKRKKRELEEPLLIANLNRFVIFPMSPSQPRG